MKTPWKSISLTLIASTALHAGTTAVVTPAKTKSWQPGSPIILASGLLTVDLQERFRVEARNNTFDFNDAANPVGDLTDDTMLLNRFRLGLLVRPSSMFGIYVQGQDSREWSDRGGVPFLLGSEGDNTFDLRQMYLDIGETGKSPVELRLGRQVLSYGDERLVGGFDWNNFGRVFDGARVRFNGLPTSSTVDVFGASVVNILPTTAAESGDWDLDQAEWDDLFFGVYASLGVLPFQKTEVYAFYRAKEDNGNIYSDPSFPQPASLLSPYDVGQDVLTLGTRHASLPGKLNGWDYEFEGVVQFGSVDRQSSATATTPGVPKGLYGGNDDSLDHFAWATHLQGGYTFADVAAKPRAGVFYDFATGDDNPSDGENNTFLNMFPTNHKFYGYMDAFAWKNLHDAGLSVNAKPTDKLTLRCDQHFFWLATTNDGWYRANGLSTVRPLNAAARSANNYAGAETDVTLTYAPAKWASILLGYSHFYAGSYLSDTGAADDADFGYLQLAITF